MRRGDEVVEGICRRVLTAASCQARRYSPPPRTFAKASTSSPGQAALTGEPRLKEMLKPP